MDSKAYKGMLGSLEQEIMDTLWARGGMSGRGVHEQIQKSRAVALTTVLTVMERLRKKDLLKKAKSHGVYIYEARQSKDEFAGSVSARLFKDVLDISTGSATASFVDALAEVDPEELKRLDLLIKKKKKELEEEGQ
ncbi:MAG: BlaI/MecI/CopY family transcriptional regulator [Thermodesulfobacteriota bacterium]